LLWQLRRGQRKAQDTTPLLWEIAFHLFNLVGFYAIILVFHEVLDGRDYRVMAPQFLISLLVLVAMRRRTLVIVMVVASLMAFPALWSILADKNPNFNGIGQAQLVHWQPIVAGAVVYDADALNAWCNTISMSEFYTRAFAGEAGLAMAIPPGIGLSWLYNWQGSDSFVVPTHIKARFVMLFHEDFENWQDHLHLRHIVDVHDGAIYDNLDSPCYAED
jgi:hypothetical protein